MVDFATWDVERVWHFLAGLLPFFREPLSSSGGTSISYDGVRGYVRESHNQPSGTLVRSGKGYDLYCRGGRVQLDPDRPMLRWLDQR